MQGNIVRMFAEGCKRRQSSCADASGVSASAHSETRPLKRRHSQSCVDTATALTAPGHGILAAQATGAAGVVDKNIIKEGAHTGISEQFEEAALRRLTTRPRFDSGKMFLGGVAVAQCYSSDTGAVILDEKTAKVDRIYWRRLPCREAAWKDKKSELMRVLRHLIGSSAAGDGHEDTLSNPSIWKVRVGFGASVSVAGQSAQCICTERVKHLHLVEHKPSKTTIAVGSSCVRHFAGEAAYLFAVKAESDAALKLAQAAQGSKNISQFFDATPSKVASEQDVLCHSSQADESGVKAFCAAIKGLTNHRPKDYQPAQALYYKVRWKDTSKPDEWIQRDKLVSDLIQKYTDVRWQKRLSDRTTDSVQNARCKAPVRSTNTLWE